MKHLIIISLLFLNMCGFSQDLSNLFDSVYDQTDINGLRQGKWIIYENDTSKRILHTIDISGIDINQAKPDTNTKKKGTIEVTTIKHTIISEGYYINNLKDSTWRSYYLLPETLRYIGPNYYQGPTRSVAIFHNDTLDGLLRTYYPSGALKSKVIFRKGIAQGNIQCYFENGRLKYDGQMIPGQMFFSGTEYSDQGARIRERKFNYDIMLRDWTDIDNIKTLLIDK